MTDFEPKPSPSTNNTESYSTPTIAEDNSSVFADSAIAECMEYEPSDANEIADTCNGLSSESNQDSTNTFLPECTYEFEDNKEDSYRQSELSDQSKIKLKPNVTGDEDVSSKEFTDSKTIDDKALRLNAIIFTKVGELNPSETAVSKPSLSTTALGKATEESPSDDAPSASVIVQKQNEPAPTESPTPSLYDTQIANNGGLSSFSLEAKDKAPDDSFPSDDIHSNIVVVQKQSGVTRSESPMPSQANSASGAALTTGNKVASLYASGTLDKKPDDRSPDDARPAPVVVQEPSKPLRQEPSSPLPSTPRDRQITNNNNSSLYASGTLDKKPDDRSPDEVSTEALTQRQNSSSTPEISKTERAADDISSSSTAATPTKTGQSLASNRINAADSANSVLYNSSKNSDLTERSQTATNQNSGAKANLVAEGSPVLSGADKIQSATQSEQLMPETGVAQGSRNDVTPDVTRSTSNIAQSANITQLADFSNSNNSIGTYAPAANQILDAMQRGVAGLFRESNSAVLSNSSSLSTSSLGYFSNMQMFGADGKPIVQNSGSLTLKESGETYIPSTGNSITNLGTVFSVNSSANLIGNNLGLNGQIIKEGQTAGNASISQSAAQALQGILQQGQGAISTKAEEAGKIIGKGVNTPALTDALATGQGGKKGANNIAEGIGQPSIGFPIVTIKGSNLEGATEIKLPISQTGNATNTGIVITATSGATAGQTAAGATTGATTNTVTGTTTGSATSNTTPTNTITGAQDAGATDIKSLVTALPNVQIFDSKKEGKADDDKSGRPEIDYDASESNDFDDDHDDDYIDAPVIETGRAQSGSIANVPKKPAQVGLSIIENIMVLINDIKNQKVDAQTAGKMWADLFIDLFGKQKRQPCTIRAEDTLESIARFVLKDARLAPLLYTINVHAKTIKPIKNSENIAEIGSIKPEAEQILLPHRSEILRYKIHVLKDSSALVLYAQNNRSLLKDFVTYACRAGDTLKSIAASHIEIQDEKMWADIALLNGLSVRVDKAGNPIAKLKEGQLLQIPRSIQQEEYEEDDELVEPPVLNMSLAGQIAKLDIKADDEEAISRTLATMEKRIISQSDLGSGTDSVLIKLELKEGSKRISVAEWNVNPTASNLKLYDKFGGCKLIPIALPTRAARELAENDLKANAERYCKMFLTGELAA